MNKHAVITGVSSGIGKSFLELLVRQNWLVTGVGRQKAPVSHSGYSHICCDFNNWKNLIPFKITDSVDLLILNSGITVYGKAADMTSVDLEQIYNVNVFGNLHILKYTLPHFNSMTSVVFISSTAVDHTYENWSAYSSSKAAVEKYLSVFAQEEKISCHSIRVGPVETGIWNGVTGPEKNKSRIMPLKVASEILEYLSGFKQSQGNYFSTVSFFEN